MNKKFLSVVLFGALMAGSSVTFTGCIDNDEPAGIEELRGAKAELIRAKVAVEAANAARENANAALILAKAEIQKAKAAYWNAQAAQEQAKADSMAAASDAERAKADSLIAHYKQKMEEAVLEHDSTMVKLQQKLAEANRQYELAIKQIEIAKATLSDSEKVTVESLQTTLDTAKGDVDRITGQVDEAEKDLYEILVKKAQGLIVDEDGGTEWLPTLKKAVERDSIQLVADEAKLADLKEFAEKDPVTTDWRAEIKELEDSIAAMNIVSSKYAVEIANFENREDVVEAALAKDAAEEAAKPENIKIDAYSYTFKFEAGKPGAGGTGNLNHGTYGHDKFELSENTANALSEVEEMLTWSKVELAKYTAERINRLEKIATDGISAEKGEYEDAVEAWKEAKDKYEKAPTDAAFKKTKETAQKAITTYDATIANINANTALTDEQKASQKLVAANTLAAALVTYYTEGAKLNLQTNEVTLPTYNPSTGAETGKAHKTVLAWLSEASYGGSNLQAILAKDSRTTAFFLVEEKEPADKENAKTGAVQSIDTKEDLLTKVKDASDGAFGKEMLVSFGGENGYMLVEPTEADVLAWINDGKVAASDLGMAGLYYEAKQAESTQEYKNYKEWMADLKVAIPSLEAEVKLIEDAIEAAETAAEEAKAAYDKLMTGIEATVKAKVVVDAKIAAAGKVKVALVDAVKTNINDATGGLINDFTTLEKFATDLKAAIKKAEDDVLTSQKSLAEAKADLQLAIDGKYDAEAGARKTLDQAMARLEAAQAEYETALKNLEIALQIMAGDASAE